MRLENRSDLEAKRTIESKFNDQRRLRRCEVKDFYSERSISKLIQNYAIICLARDSKQLEAYRNRFIDISHRQIEIF